MGLYSYCSMSTTWACDKFQSEDEINISTCICILVSKPSLIFAEIKTSELQETYIRIISHAQENNLSQILHTLERGKKALLRAAVADEDITCVKYLLQCDTDVNLQWDRYGDQSTPAQRVAQSLCLESVSDSEKQEAVERKVVNILLSCDTCYEKFNELSMTYVRQVQCIYSHMLKSSCTPLYCAARKANLPIMTELLKAGCDMYVDCGLYCGTYTTYTPLPHIGVPGLAVLQNSIPMLELLLAHGLDVNRLSNTVVEYAQENTLRLLLQQGIKRSILTKQYTLLGIVAGNCRMCDGDVSLMNRCRIVIRQQLARCSDLNMFSCIEQGLANVLPKPILHYLSFGMSMYQDEED